jgi:ferredoxin hydrogenase large subunit
MKRDDIRFELKHEVLKAVAENQFKGTMNLETFEAIPFEIIPGITPKFRCCVYKEREIIRQRTRLAMSMMPIPRDNYEHIAMNEHVIQVIPAACEGCPINRFQVTENCQNCMQKACQKACAFDAISITPRGAYIDQSKCRECGRCSEACPYHAIADLMRPCKRSCDVKAIEIGANKLAQIDNKKCIACGHCVTACPFGAISDISYITKVIDAIKDPDTVTVAIPAPAVEGQFGPNATVGRVKTALKQLGFDYVYEVALGGDLVSMHEAKELIENKEQGKKMTTSCCPGFVNLIRKHYPQLMEYVSTTVSPMQANVRYIQKKHPGAFVVFIGPCIAKKFEAEMMKAPNAVMTFEELNALFDARRIDPNECDEDIAPDATSYGRRFSGAGGVAASVVKAAEECGVTGIKTKPCSGVKECKVALAMLKAGKLPEDIIEGMACDGGCIAGPGSIATIQQLKAARLKKIKGKDDDSIGGMLADMDALDVDMVRESFDMPERPEFILKNRVHELG